MAVTTTITFDQPRPRKFARHTAMRSGRIVFDHYITNGCVVDFSSYFRSVQQVVFSDFAGGYALEYDYTNLKAKVYSATNAAHTHGLGNGVATFTGDSLVHGLGNGKIVVTGNIASVTANLQFANSRLEMNAAGGNAALAGNTNATTITGNVALTGLTNSATAASALSEVTNSTDLSTALANVCFVVYGTV